MNSSLTMQINGKVKTAIATTEGDRPYHKFAVTTRVKTYSPTQRKQLWSPITVFVTVFGRLNDTVKNHLSQEGAIAIVNNAQIEISLAVKDGAPLRYNSGDRAGEYMYNYNATVNADNLVLPPRPQETVGAATGQTGGGESTPQQGGGDDSEWL